MCYKYMKSNYSGTTGYVLAIVVGWVFFICFSFYHFLGVGPDDVFIFLWTGENLHKSYWFVNYNFQTQEMVSSILVPLIIKLISIFISEEVFFYPTRYWVFSVPPWYFGYFGLGVITSSVPSNPS